MYAKCLFIERSNTASHTFIHFAYIHPFNWEITSLKGLCERLMAHKGNDTFHEEVTVFSNSQIDNAKFKPYKLSR